MATQYEKYNSGDDSTIAVYGTTWAAQTFTPSTAHKIEYVKLKCNRAGTPGTLTVGIRATSGGEPTGSDLCSGTTNANAFTTGPSGTFYTITLGSGYNLSASTQYAIVIRATSGNITNYVGWRCDNSSPTYTGGMRIYSGNSGSTWAKVSANDFMFEDWGTAVTTYYQATGGATMSIAGALARLGNFYRAIGSAAMSIAGTLTITAVLIHKAVGGASMAITGTLARLGSFYKTVGSATQSIAGTLIAGGFDAKAVGGATVAIAGTLVRLPKKWAGRASMTITGTLQRATVHAKIAVGAGTVVIAGAVARMGTFYKAIGGGTIAIASTLVKVGQWITLTLKSRSQSLTLWIRTVALKLKSRE